MSELTESPRRGGLPTGPRRGGLPTGPMSAAGRAEQLRSQVPQLEDFAKKPAVGAHKPKVEKDPVPTTRYESVGHISIESILSGENKYERFEKEIKAYSESMHEALKAAGLTNKVTSARQGNREDESAIRHFLDNALLSEIVQDTRAPRGEDRQFLIGAVINEIVGLGPLQALWDSPEVTEILVHGPKNIRVEIKGRPRRVPGASFRNTEHLLELCQKILDYSGRRVDLKSPIADGRFPDQSRIHVTHPIISPRGPNLTIRRHREEAWTLKELVSRESLSEEMVEDLFWLIHAGCSTVIVGGTGTGKTTMLNAMSGLFPDNDIIVTIEDNLELMIDPSRMSAAPLEARPPSAAGTGGVSIRDLVKASLRMRPDRIIVGECRDGAAYDMLQAMNTGHNGSMTTIHANSAFAAIDRLADLVGMAGEISPQGALSLIASAVDLLVFIERFPEDGSRRISGIYEVPSSSTADASGQGTIEPIPLWEFQHTSTDKENGNKVIGHWEKINDPSPALIRAHSLDRREPRSLEEVYRHIQNLEWQE